MAVATQQRPAPAASPRTIQGTVVRTGGRTSQGVTRTRRVSTARPAAAASSRARNVQVGRPSAGASTGLGGNYQAAILMEFIAAVTLTALTPVATKANPDGLSPYAGKDLVKLAAITVTYLILAGISSVNRGAGRVAMWIGLLILLADGLFEASNIVSDINLFTGTGPNLPASADVQTAQAADTQGLAGGLATPLPASAFNVPNLYGTVAPTFAPTGTGQAAGTTTAAGRGSGG